MQKTRRGRILVGAALLGFLLSYVSGALGPAIVAVGLCGFVAWARLRFRALLRESNFQLERRPPDDTVYQDETAIVRTRILVGPPGVRVKIAEEGPPDALVEGTTARPGATTAEGVVFDVETRVRPLRRGPFALRTLLVTLSDPDGLFRRTHRVQAPVEFTAHAPRSAFREGRAVRDIQAVIVPRRSDPGEWSDEVLSHRPYVPTDRPRDIDWKVSSRYDELLSRTFLREVERPLLLVLDASRTMRHRAGGRSMLDHGAEFVMYLLGAAWRKGTAVGFIAHDEHRILHLFKPGRDDQLPRLVANALAELPPPIDVPAEGALEAVLAGASGGAREAAPFEAAVAPFLGAGRSRRIPHGLGRALTLAAPSGLPRNIVAFSDLAYRTGHAITALAGAQRHQHNVLLAAPFPPWYRARPDEITPELLEALHGQWERRRRVLARLEAGGVRVVDLAPRMEARELLDVAVAGVGPR